MVSAGGCSPPGRTKGTRWPSARAGGAAAGRPGRCGHPHPEGGQRVPVRAAPSPGSPALGSQRPASSWSHQRDLPSPAAAGPGHPEGSARASFRDGKALGARQPEGRGRGASGEPKTRLRRGRRVSASHLGIRNRGTNLGFPLGVGGGSKLDGVPLEDSDQTNSGFLFPGVREGCKRPAGTTPGEFGKPVRPWTTHLEGVGRSPCSHARTLPSVCPSSHKKPKP